jgi:hypothetical protein
VIIQQAVWLEKLGWNQESKPDKWLEGVAGKFRMWSLIDNDNENTKSITIIFGRSCGGIVVILSIVRLVQLLVFTECSWARLTSIAYKTTWNEELMNISLSSFTYALLMMEQTQMAAVMVLANTMRCPSELGQLARYHVTPIKIISFQKLKSPNTGEFEPNQTVEGDDAEFLIGSLSRTSPWW